MKINRLMVEVTFKCINKPCRFCNRNYLIKNNLYEEKDIEKDAIINVFNKNDIDVIHFTSSVGESAFHKDFTEIIKAARKESNIGIEWNTNGYPKSSKWWYELGKLLNRKNDIVIFALDGINAETHNKHRKTDFNKVFYNMISFIKGGGNAIWQIIVFKHNEHQIEKIKKAAKIFGCKEIIIRNSKKYDDVLQAPCSLNYNESRLSLFEETHEKNIVCDAKENGTFYIDASGYVWPCCVIPGYQQIDCIYKKNKEKNVISDKILQIFEEEKEILSIYNESSLEKIMNKSKLLDYILNNTENEKCCDYYCNINRKFGKKFSRRFYL